MVIIFTNIFNFNIIVFEIVFIKLLCLNENYIHFNTQFSNALKYQFIILHNIFNINNQLSRYMMYELLLF